MDYHLLSKTFWSEDPRSISEIPRFGLGGNSFQARCISRKIKKMLSRTVTKDIPLTVPTYVQKLPRDPRVQFLHEDIKELDKKNVCSSPTLNIEFESM